MKRLSYFFAAVENWTIILAFSLIVLVTSVNVTTRYLGNTSLAFTEEITINLLVVMTLVGAVAALRTHAHLGFTYIIDTVPLAVARILIWISTAVVIGFLLVLVVYGTEMVIGQIDNGRATPSLRIPQFIFTASIPIAGLLGIFRAVGAARRSIAGHGTGEVLEGEARAALEISHLHEEGGDQK